MLRTLLQDRFMLVSHFETRIESVYSLVVNKGGLKVKAVDADVKTSYSSSAVSLHGVMAASDIANQLGDDLRRTVVDNTGLSARYLVDLRWTPSVQVEDGSDPSIFTALQGATRDEAGVGESTSARVGSRFCDADV